MLLAPLLFCFFFYNGYPAYALGCVAIIILQILVLIFKILFNVE